MNDMMLPGVIETDNNSDWTVVCAICSKNMILNHETMIGYKGNHICINCAKKMYSLMHSRGLETEIELEDGQIYDGNKMGFLMQTQGVK